MNDKEKVTEPSAPKVEPLARKDWIPCPICESECDGVFCHACRNQKTARNIAAWFNTSAVDMPEVVKQIAEMLPTQATETASAPQLSNDDEIPRRNRALVSAIRSDDNGLVDLSTELSKIKGMEHWVARLRNYALALEAAIVRNEFPAAPSVAEMQVEQEKYLKFLRWFKLFYKFFQEDVRSKPSAYASSLLEDVELQEFIREADRIR